MRALRLRRCWKRPRFSSKVGSNPASRTDLANGDESCLLIPVTIYGIERPFDTSLRDHRGGDSIELGQSLHRRQTERSCTQVSHREARQDRPVRSRQGYQSRRSWRQGCSRQRIAVSRTDSAELLSVENGDQSITRRYPGCVGLDTRRIR